MADALSVIMPVYNGLPDRFERQLAPMLADPTLLVLGTAMISTDAESR